MTPKRVIKLAGHRQVPPWVMKLVMDAITEEREACAKVCETAMIPNPTTSMFDAGVNSTAGMCAAVIRSRCSPPSEKN